MATHATVYEHDPALGHEFAAITGKTDECRRCGCWVNEARNGLGYNGSMYDKPCTRAHTGDSSHG